MKSFEGFKRRAVVIVPADDEFQSRVAKREAEEGKDVPDTAVLEMKGGFVWFVWLWVCVFLSTCVPWLVLENFVSLYFSPPSFTRVGLVKLLETWLDTVLFWSHSFLLNNCVLNSEISLPPVLIRPFKVHIYYYLL